MKCFKLKTIILGDSGVGKTTLSYKYYNQTYVTNSQSTVGVNFISKYVDVYDDKKINYKYGILRDRKDYGL